MPAMALTYALQSREKLAKVEDEGIICMDETERRKLDYDTVSAPLVIIPWMLVTLTSARCTQAELLLDVYLELRNYTEAVKYGDACCERGKAEARSIRLYAMALDFSGDTTKANQMFEKATDAVREEQGSGLMKYAFELYNSGRKSYAWQTAKKLGPLGGTVDDQKGKADPPHGNGGWDSPPAEENPYYTSQCDFDRRDIATLTVEEFVTEYYEMSKPCILFGEGLIKGDAWQKWTRSKLEAAIGDVKIKLSKSSQITNTDVRNKVPNAKNQVPLSEYLRSFEDREMTASADANYFFRNATSYFPEITNLMEPNEYFEDNAFAYDERTRDMLKLFVLGPANSSTYWHGE
jgi:hypothetical protein